MGGERSEMPLSEIPVGGSFLIRNLEGPDCEQLGRLGFHEGGKVRKVASGRNMVCALNGTRLALSRELAAQVLVSPV